ncbi:hypothetical protein BH10BAC2_BH10BAC2_07120 [soil metagenome]
MKKYILLFILAFAIGKSFGQNPANSIKTKDYYLHKSKNQKTTGWILLGSGVAAIGTFLVIDNIDYGVIGIVGLGSLAALQSFDVSQYLW